MKSKNWFEVDKKGLRQLQEGKPISHLMRELIQNAFDEDVTKCVVKMDYSHGKATISVEDDSPIGFRDLTDAYTLFKETYKRVDVSKRGRFNLGEKQVFSLCDTAEIITTTGGIRFDKDGRHTLRRKRVQGSVITVTLRMKRKEYEECYDYCLQVLVPQQIRLSIESNDNNQTIPFKTPYKSLEANLKTEWLDGERIVQRKKECTVNLHKPNGRALLYEMGLPVCSIECDYSINIQQKIPMSADRDKVSQKYLKDLYAYTLNATHQEIESERSSQQWVRDATTSKYVEDVAVKDIITKRFGEKSTIANPFDPNSIDEAISRNYNVVHGSEMSKEEWGKVKDLGIMKTSTELFGTGFASATTVNPTNVQKRIGDFAIKIARELLGLNISVTYVKSPEASTVAQYSKDNRLMFNLSNLEKVYWETPSDVIGSQMLDLIIHELGHSQGMHYEQSYHKCITKLGAELTLKALGNPNWFKI